MRMESDLKWLLRCVSPYRLRIAMGLLCSSVAAALTSVDPLLLRSLIDYAWPLHRMKLTIFLIAAIGICYIIRTALTGLNGVLILRITQETIRDLRTRLLSQMLRLSMDYHERTPVGDKLMRIEQDVDQIAVMGADTANQSLRALLLFVVNLALIAKLNIVMTIALLPLFPAFVIIQQRFRKRLKSKAEIARSAFGSARDVLTEHVGASTQIQFLGAERISLQRMSMLWDRTFIAERNQRHTQILFGLSISGITITSIVAILGIGTYEVERQSLTIGAIVAFYTLVTRVFDPISSALDLYARIQGLGVSVKRVREVLALEPNVSDRGTIELDGSIMKDPIQLKSVGLIYGTREVLSDICVDINHGERIALVGASGSGKSSLARLLVRASDPTMGRISVGSTHLKDFTLASIRKSICYVPQCPVLFHGTIRENLLFANPHAPDSAMIRALKAAQFESVLNRLPEGLGTQLGPFAHTLSGGEKQRLAIARALLRNAQVLLLDEATSALDGPTERAILEHLDSLQNGATLILISHRLQSLTWVDRIVLMAEGAIRDMGDHNALYRRSKLYRDLYNTSIDSVSTGFPQEIIVRDTQIPTSNSPDYRILRALN